MNTELYRSSVKGHGLCNIVIHEVRELSQGRELFNGSFDGTGFYEPQCGI